jgi:hypothetical protein
VALIFVFRQRVPFVEGGGEEVWRVNSRIHDGTGNSSFVRSAFD